MVRKAAWTSRRCGCGKPVMTRFQLDAAYCGASRCWDAVFRRLGYVPSKKALARRKKERARRRREAIRRRAVERAGGKR